ncbi:hypothetical protein [Pelomonas sp. V22]|nr:hypothetical protein [Pelomonas sp. V22]
MPQTYTVGHRSALASAWTWTRKLLGLREPQAWPPRQRLAR